MGKREFDNVLSLRGADNIKTVIAPSGYARSKLSLRGEQESSTWQSQQNKIIGRDPHVSPLDFFRMRSLLIGRFLDVFWRKREVSLPTVILGHIIFLQVILGQQRVTRVSRIIKWILGSSPRMTAELIFFICTSMTSTVRAECVPSPNCAEIGYTATSCTGDSLKCPFDTSKLFCIPCDSSYQYTCTGTGQKGKGTSCDGKYVECECNAGYDLVDGNCVISCAYTLTSLPTGCSAVSDSCTKNGTTYYSSTCTSCKNGYTINTGTCKANTCSGYYSSKTGCSNYSTCQSGTATKYKCTACNDGYTLSSGLCSENYCSGYQNNLRACTSYSTCTTYTGKTTYKCTACESNYIIKNGACVDEYCYNEFLNNYGFGHNIWEEKSSSYYSDCPYSCTSSVNGITYWGGASGACDE